MDTVGPVAVAVSVVLVGIVVRLITAQAADGHLDRNGVVGIRTRATTRSDAAWRAGHAAALPTIRVGALVGYALAAVTVGAAFVLSGRPYALILGLVALGVLVVFIVVAARSAVLAARSVE